MDATTGANTKTASLNIGNESWSFPIYEGTIGPEVIDISKLTGKDVKFGATVTLIDDDKSGRKRDNCLDAPAGASRTVWCFAGGGSELCGLACELGRCSRRRPRTRHTRGRRRRPAQGFDEPARLL